MTIEKRLSTDLVYNYMKSEDRSIYDRHSSDLVKSALSEVSNVISGSIIPIMTVLAQLVTSVLVFVLLLVVNFKVTVSLVLFITLSYLLIYFALGKHLDRWGAIKFESNENRFKFATEAFSSLKEIKAYGAEDQFLKKFDTQDY